MADNIVKCPSCGTKNDTELDCKCQECGRVLPGESSPVPLTPYWMEWAPDDGPKVQRTAPDANALATILAALIVEIDKDRQFVRHFGCGTFAVVQRLTPGQSRNLDLPTGRLYFGLD
jgi:hypothetical protein